MATKTWDFERLRYLRFLEFTGKMTENELMAEDELKESISVAAFFGDFERLNCLRKEHGDDRMIKSCGIDKYRDNPLHQALSSVAYTEGRYFKGIVKPINRRDYVETIRILLDMGLDASIRNGLGTPPLVQACMYPEPDAFLNVNIVRLLLHHQAYVNGTDTNTSSTALHYATIFGYCSIASELIRYGADIEALDKKGQTPLFVAAVHYTETCKAESEREEDTDTMLLLLLKGARVVDCKDAQGVTLMDAIFDDEDIIPEELYKLHGWKLLNSCKKIQGL